MTINKNTANQVPIQFKVGKFYTHEELEHLRFLAGNSTNQEEREQARRKLEIHERSILITKENIIDLAASFKIPLVEGRFEPTLKDLKNLYECMMNRSSKKHDDATIMLKYLGAKDSKIIEYIQTLHAADWKQVADNIGAMGDSYAESLMKNKPGKM